MNEKFLSFMIFDLFQRLACDLYVGKQDCLCVEEKARKIERHKYVNKREFLDFLFHFHENLKVQM